MPIHPALISAAGQAGSLSYFQSIFLGILQGVAELFPISSLGHTVIIPALLGKHWHSWNSFVAAQSAKESFYLAFIVLLHVGTALGLLVYFRRDWIKIIGAFFHTLTTRRIRTADERMAWLIVVATIPAGITGLLLEKFLRTHFLKPLPASIFLVVNGIILIAGEQLRRKAAFRTTKPDELGLSTAAVVGVAQTAALLPGISRSGITMVAGLLRGLSHEDAARFAFLLATPIILAAGVLKIPDLLGPLGQGIRSQAIVGGLFAAVTAYLVTAFLVRLFKTQSLLPFGIYCLIAGAACVAVFL